MNTERANAEWVRSVLPLQAGQYVEAGAFDGVGASCTLPLYSLGWRGLLIEPQPHFQSLARRNRPHDRHQRVALWDSEGVGDFSMSLDYPGRSGLIETLGAKAKFHERALRAMIETKRLHVAMHDAGMPRQVDYVALDLEGAERRVLEAFDWDRFAVSLWTVEGEGYGDIFEPRGYRRVVNPFLPDSRDECWLKGEA